MSNKGRVNMKDFCCICKRYKKIAVFQTFIPEGKFKEVSYPVCEDCVGGNVLLCASCLKYKEVAGYGVWFIPEEGRAILYTLCSDCTKEMTMPEHKEAVMNGIEKHICAKV